MNTEWFDEHLANFLAAESDAAMDRWRDALCGALDEATSRPEWDAFVQAGRAHPLRAAVHEDPYQRRAWHKPRGYAGDAVMLDMIYRGLDGIPDEERAQLTPHGARLFESWQRCGGCGSVRERADELARRIRASAERRPGARILSVACGHLRELEQLDADTWASIEDFVGVDQDEESLIEARRACGADQLRLEAVSVKRILRGEWRPDAPFDLIYSAGLFDYLTDDVANRLIMTLFGMLRPGGSLLIGNFQRTREMAFGTIFQDWTLVTRRPEDMLRLVRPQDLPLDTTVESFEDSRGGMAWLEVARPSKPLHHPETRTIAPQPAALG